MCVIFTLLCPHIDVAHKCKNLLFKMKRDKGMADHENKSSIHTVYIHKPIPYIFADLLYSGPLVSQASTTSHPLYPAWFTVFAHALHNSN